MYDITDASLNNGIFRPKGHDSVWIFVTETKTADRTQYVDLLEGHTLRCDGQSLGRTDRMIIEHESRGIELLLFYRKTRTEHPGAGFRYEGPFRYVSHSGANPTHFVLQRIDPIVAVVERDLQALRAEESYQEGKRSFVLINRFERNPKLRAAAIAIHGTTCQGCGFSFRDVYGLRGDGFIEVHHLRPLADYPGEIDVDPRTDMAVLCPNCHRMVHRRIDDLLDLDSLRRLVAASRGVS
jgi:5-methylcytosine-specific restriction protein A